ncbi:MAG: periplasmic heavy metal sensor [Geobacter sp.]|nr:periplasmic heavy metal sensor [Geobacter sp.]
MTVTFRRLATAVAVIIGIGVMPIVAPAYMGGEEGAPAGKHFRKMASELGLSAEQNRAIKDIFKKNRPLAAPLLKQLATERRVLRTLIQAETVDEAAIRAQSAKVAAVEADLAVQRAHGAQEIRKVLTPEQIQKFKAIQEKRDSKLDRFISRSERKLEQAQ